MLIKLVEPVVILLSLALVQTFIYRAFNDKKYPFLVATGLLFGIMAVLAMMMPYAYKPGFIFDSRSVIISISGFFYGPITAVIAALIAALYRLSLGGAGAIAGALVVFVCAISGSCFYYIRSKGKFATRPLNLLVFGVVTHFFAILPLLILPEAVRWMVMRNLSIPFFLLYPPATVFLGIIILSIEKMFNTERELKNTVDALNLKTKALEETTEKFISLANNVPGAVSYLNAGTLLFEYTNEGFINTFGISEDKIIGTHIKDFLGEENYQYALPYFEEALSGKKVSYEKHLDLGKGKRWIRDNYNPVFYANGQVASIAILTYDLTDLKEQEEEHKRVILQLQDKNAEQERFIYTVSHDLKTPLVNITGFADLAEIDLNSGDQASAKNDLAIIKQSAIRMKRLLDELIEMSRIGIKKNPEEVLNLNTLIDEVIYNISGLIDECHTTIEVEPDLPDVRFDKRQFLQVVENLIANASRYSRSANGGSLVNFGVIRNDEELIFYVKDNGIGIEAEYLEQIFGLFERLSPDSDGTGVGLAIVKRIIETHGGRIWAESEGLGHGTTFFFTVPEA